MSRPGRPLDRPLLAFTLYVAAAALAGDREGPVLCPLRRLTGRRCPACGLTRAIARTARLDLPGAVARNPAGPVVVAAVLGRAAFRAARIERKETVCGSTT